MDNLKNWIRENSHKMDMDQPPASVWESLKRRLLKPGDADPLRNHIAANKAELQVETPDPLTWEKISRSVATKKPVPVQRLTRGLIYLSAACIIIIISLGLFRYMNGAQTNPGNELAEKPAIKKVIPSNDTTTTELTKNQSIPTPSLPGKTHKPTNKYKSIAVASKPAKKQKNKSLPPVVLQIEKDYDELIAGQIKYTKSLAIYGESAGYFQEFMNDFKALEKQEKELRNSIAQKGLQENSIDDLTTLYQQKLTILKKLQTEINKTSNRNKNVTDTIPTYISL